MYLFIHIYAIFKGVRGAMVQTQKIRNITDQQALGKIKTLGSAGEGVKKETAAFKSGNGMIRRVSSMDSKVLICEMYIYICLCVYLYKYLYICLYVNIHIYIYV
jgi:hypothetical protein